MSERLKELQSVVDHISHIKNLVYTFERGCLSIRKGWKTVVIVNSESHGFIVSISENCTSCSFVVGSDIELVKRVANYFAVTGIFNTMYLEEAREGK